jgi:hypothetical protein
MDKYARRPAATELQLIQVNGQDLDNARGAALGSRIPGMGDGGVVAIP